MTGTAITKRAAIHTRGLQDRVRVLALKNAKLRVQLSNAKRFSIKLRQSIGEVVISVDHIETLLKTLERRKKKSLCKVNL